jgi:hypothetical protein
MDQFMQKTPLSVRACRTDKKLLTSCWISNDLDLVSPSDGTDRQGDKFPAVFVLPIQTRVLGSHNAVHCIQGLRQAGPQMYSVNGHG